MKTEQKRLFENFMSLGILQIISYLLPLIYLPYLSRVLGVEYFGIVFFVLAVMNCFTIFAEFGFANSAPLKIALNRHNKNNLSNIFSSVLCIKFLLSVIGFIILLFMIAFIPKLNLYKNIFLVSFLIVIGNVLYTGWFFQGMERMKYITFLNVFYKLMFFILIFCFVKKQSDYILVPLLDSLGNIVSGIIGLFIAVKSFKIKIYIPKLKSLIKQFKYSSEFFLSRISILMYCNINAVCLGITNSNIMVGYYIAAEKIYFALNALQEPLNQAIYPYIARYKDIKTYKKLFFASCVVIVIMSMLIFFLSKIIITVFYGADMTEAYKILKIFCLISLIVFPAALIGYPLLGAMGHANIVNKSTIIASLVHITGLLILYLTKNMNIYTVSYMVLITESVVFIIRFFAVSKYKLFTYKSEKLSKPV